MKTPRAPMLKLAWLDLRHEWILTLCMVLAIAAIIAPLLILLGLKHGTVTTLRDRLVEDPLNRKIESLLTLRLTPDWFAEMRQRDDVAFVMPMILQGASVIDVKTPEDRWHVLDLRPTAPGDPLLMQNGGIIPDADSLVINYPAAEELDVQTGDTLLLRTTRGYQGGKTFEDKEFRIAAVLPPRAGDTATLYARWEFAEAVEDYREGQAVPAFGWPGDERQAFFSYDGVWVLSENPISPTTVSRLTGNTGFTHWETDASLSEVFTASFGVTPPPQLKLQRLSVHGRTVGAANFKHIRPLLAGQGRFVLLPYVDNVPIAVEGMRLSGVSIAPEDAQLLGWPAPPWGDFDEQADFARQAQILPPTAPADSNTLQLRASGTFGQLQIPLKAVARPAEFPLATSHAWLPIELLGSLRTAQDKNVVYDPLIPGLMLKKSGYRGFRLFAKSIDDVPDLYRWLLAQGLQVEANSKKIEQVKTLDQGLTRLFWLLALVGFSGAIATLVVSLYASVERKRRDLGILRLMGVTRAETFWFPIYQGQIIGWLGGGLAVLVYHALAELINWVFTAELDSGQKICTLPILYFIISLLLTLFLAALAALLAAWRASLIEPATAIREE